jgi:adenylate cyclase
MSDNAPETGPVPEFFMSEKSSATSRVLVDRATSWLMAQALTDADLETVVRGCCERLHAAGIPLARVHLSFSVLHPLYSALGFTWRRSEGLKVEGYRHSPGGKQNERFRVSPYYHIMKHNLEHLRRRLDTDSPSEFPIFDDLKKEGLTDYLAFVTGFDATKRQGMMGSWSTNSRDGFSDDEIEALIRVQDRLAVAAKMAVRGDVAKSALMTYLGPNAGQRVLSGQIKRGDGETIRAAIVWGDLRNSTAMAEQLGRQVYIDNLNAFFDNVAGAVADAGGEILDFVGDGFLAIFPCERNQKESTEACQLALAGAMEAVTRMEATNRERVARGELPLGFGLGLHIGNVMFGNVGLADRLAFSVFGSAVNEATRLEQLTKKFNTPVIASAAFRDYCGGGWDLLGSEILRGSDSAMEVIRPALKDGQRPNFHVVRRDRTRHMSDAEAVVVLHRDNAA